MIMNRKQKRFLKRLQRTALSLLVAGALTAGIVDDDNSSSALNPYFDDITGDIIRIYGGGGGGGGFGSCSGNSGSGGNSHIEFWDDSDTLHFKNGDGNSLGNSIAGGSAAAWFYDGYQWVSYIVVNGGRSGPFGLDDNLYLPTYMGTHEFKQCSQMFSCSCSVQRERVWSGSVWIQTTIVDCPDCDNNCLSNQDCSPDKCACVEYSDCFTDNYVLIPVGSHHNYSLTNPSQWCFNCYSSPCLELPSCFNCLNCGQNPCIENYYCFNIEYYPCEKAVWMNTTEGIYSLGYGYWDGGAGGNGSIVTVSDMMLSTTFDIYAGSGGQASPLGTGGDGGSIMVAIGGNLTVPSLNIEAGDDGAVNDIFHQDTYDIFNSGDGGSVVVGVGDNLTVSELNMVSGDSENGGNVTVEAGRTVNARNITMKSNGDGTRSGTATLKANTLRAANGYTMSLQDNAVLNISNYIFDIGGSADGDVILNVTDDAVFLAKNTNIILTGIPGNLNPGDEIVLISRITGDFTPINSDITLGGYTFSIALNSAGNQLVATVQDESAPTNPNSGFGGGGIAGFMTLDVELELDEEIQTETDSTENQPNQPSTDGISQTGESGYDYYIVNFDFNIKFNFNDDSDNDPIKIWVRSDNLISQKSIPDTYREGYIFFGWYTCPRGCSDSIWNFIQYTVTKDITLYAIWNIGTYTIKFNNVGGENGPTDKNITFGQQIPKSVNVPEKTGHTFRGYYSEPDGKGEQYYNKDGKREYDEVWSKENGITLYADWELNPTVTFNWNYSGGKQEEIMTDENGKLLKLPAEPKRDEYVFNGWFKSKTGGSPVDLKQLSITNNINLYAQWTEIPQDNVSKVVKNAWSYKNSGSLPSYVVKMHSIRYVCQSYNYFFPNNDIIKAENISSTTLANRKNYHYYLWRDVAGYTLGCTVASTSVALDLMGIDALPWRICETFSVNTANMESWNLPKWGIKRNERFTINDLNTMFDDFYKNPSKYSPPIIGYTLSGWKHYIVILGETETKGVYYALDSSKPNTILFNSNQITMYNNVWRFEKT